MSVEDDLLSVRRELKFLTLQRLSGPLDSTSLERYQALCAMEKRLLSSTASLAR